MVAMDEVSGGPCTGRVVSLLEGTLNEFHLLLTFMINTSLI